MKPKGPDQNSTADATADDTAVAETIDQGPSGDPRPSPSRDSEIALSNPAIPGENAVIADKYRIDRVLGKGGMGAVFAATHLVTGKRVAIKWMLPSFSGKSEAAARFLRESQAAGRINHPNVVDIYDIGEYSGSPFLVMELLEGEPLTKKLNNGPLQPDEAIGLIMPALRGVDTAHRLNVIHRDLKPDNIFLCRAPGPSPVVPKVLDFGVSKILQLDSEPNRSLTQSSEILGTPYYMAPEQAFEKDRVDHRVDIYAFGVILYEMLTGVRPFEADSYNALIVKLATERPKPIAERRPELSRDLCKVVEKAMAPDPDDRYSDIESLAIALQPFAPGVVFRPSESPAVALIESKAPIGSPPSGALTAVQPARGVRVVIQITVVAVAIILLGRLAFWIIESKNRETPIASDSSDNSPVRKSRTDGRVTSEQIGVRHSKLERSNATGEIRKQTAVKKNKDKTAIAEVAEEKTAKRVDPSLISRTIRVIPKKAKIFVDNELIGNSEVTLKRPSKSAIDIRITAAGYREWKRKGILIDDLPSTVLLRPIKPHSNQETPQPKCVGDLCESPYGQPAP